MKPAPTTNGRTMNPLDTLLTAVFADASPEGGGYAAAPMPLAPWVRLVRDAMTEQGGQWGVAALRIMNPSTLKVKDVVNGRYAIECREGNISAWLRHGDHALYKADVDPVEPISPIVSALFSKAGYTSNGYTLRATSPTDITLSLSGETVTAEFNPPLQAKYGFGVDISTIKATERQLTIVLPGILPDKVIPLGET